MKLTNTLLNLLGASVFAVAPAANAAVTVTPIVGYDPNTDWTGLTAGIDFNDGSPTQSGFAGIAASNNKSYNVTHNGITFDIVVTGANISNANRDRGAAYGDLVRDFEQWYGNGATPAEAAFTMTGLNANTDYDISFFTYNAGSGQMTHSFYEGTSSSDPLITTFQTAGNPGPTWTPGVTFRINSGSSSTIAVTVQDVGSRITIGGVAVQVVPEPSSTALLGLGGLALLLRRRR